MANTWWKLGPEPRSDLTLMPMLLTLLHTAPGLIIHLQNQPPNRPWPWGYSCYPELSLGQPEEKGPSTLQAGVPLYPNKAKRGKGKGIVFFTSVVKLQENFLPSGPAISSANHFHPNKATGEKDKGSQLQQTVQGPRASHFCLQWKLHRTI